MIKNQIPHSFFKSLRDRSQFQNSNVVVLDLVNSNLDSTDEGKAIATDLATTLPKWSTLILYTPTNRSPVFEALNQLSDQERTVDYAIANMKLTLMDRVIGAADASDALNR